MDWLGHRIGAQTGLGFGVLMDDFNDLSMYFFLVPTKRLALILACQAGFFSVYTFWIFNPNNLDQASMLKSDLHIL